MGLFSVPNSTGLPGVPESSKMIPSSTVVDEVLRYKKTLEETPSDDEIIDVLKFLEGLDVDKSLLSRTKIGVAVTRHKQSKNPTIATKSRKLVEKWRSAVSQMSGKVKPPSQRIGSECPDSSSGESMIWSHDCTDLLMD